MKYYVVERHYNLKGKLVLESRITGDITDLSWAKTQMDTRFNQKLIDYRHEIKPGAITFGSMKCAMKLSGGEYEIEIIKKAPAALTARELIIAINTMNKGDFHLNIDTLTLSKYKDIDMSKYLKGSSGKITTILDLDYPNRIKTGVPAMPFVLYYKGDLSLIDSTKYIKLAVGISRDTDLKLKLKAKEDIRDLPSNVVIISSDTDIIMSCLECTHRHKVIFIKPCGIDQKDYHVDPILEDIIVNQGGLVISSFPDKVPCSSVNSLIRCKLMGSICDALFIVSASQSSSINALVSFALQAGRDVMAYPTWPNYGNTINNTLISEGAALVEEASDIIDIIQK